MTHCVLGFIPVYRGVLGGLLPKIREPIKGGWAGRAAVYRHQKRRVPRHAHEVVKQHGQFTLAHGMNGLMKVQ